MRVTYLSDQMTLLCMHAHALVSQDHSAVSTEQLEDNFKAVDNLQQLKFASETRDRNVQTEYRDTAAQTNPWAPPYFTSGEGSTPEILTLAMLSWENGLPAGMHEVEIIERLRIKRAWEKVLPPMDNPENIQKRKDILEAIERDEWSFREKEIETIHQMRLDLAKHHLDEVQKILSTKMADRLERLRRLKEKEKEIKTTKINIETNRALRKLTNKHKGVSMRYRKPNVIDEYTDKTSEFYGPLMRHGENPKRRHEVITIQSNFLSQMKGLEILEKMPKWIPTYDFIKATALKRKRRELCIHETRWTDEVLAKLYKDLKAICRKTEDNCNGRTMKTAQQNDKSGVEEEEKKILYADDMTILNSDQNMEQLERRAYIFANVTAQWLLENELVINLKKTMYAVFKNKEKAVDMDLEVDGTRLEEVESARFLGILVDNELKWKKHINNVSIRMDLEKRSGSVTLHLVKKIHHQKPLSVSGSIEGIRDSEENTYQAATFLQAVIKGRAIQAMMSEGREKCQDLIEDYKRTKSLDDSDISVITDRLETRMLQRELAVERDQDSNWLAMCNYLDGLSLSGILNFLLKEMTRLQDERRAHAFALLAERERTLRECVEAERRQAEERRRREHDEVFKQLMKVSQDTVDTYLEDIILESMDWMPKSQAREYIKEVAKKIDRAAEEAHVRNDILEQEELVSSLIHTFVIPEAEKIQARKQIRLQQEKYLRVAHAAIYGSDDTADEEEMEGVKSVSVTKLEESTENTKEVKTEEDGTVLQDNCEHCDTTD
ncbi:cilia- and flagella-associated protein 91-like [Schistocerca piceifrons]|uniref:cilia- and flagella-associated protein 91-like n=1 Tax=Schistocerca piceifrons TaxID=274613 RepID=UPI001F5F5A55|nr:cilia- and flagella-associated protein 91-like [Schistocerca piceifrons]